MSPHNLELGPEAGVNSLIASLIVTDLPEIGIQEGGGPVHPGVLLSLDPDSRSQAQITSPAGTFLSLQFETAGEARWIALHIDLCGADLAGRQVLGLVCRSQAPQSTTFRPCLRSGQEGAGFSDVFFPKTAISYAESSLHIDTLLLETRPDLMRPAPWRELVLFFRPESSRIVLQDLRLFLV